MREPTKARVFSSSSAREIKRSAACGWADPRRQPRDVVNQQRPLQAGSARRAGAPCLQAGAYAGAQPFTPARGPT